MAEFARGLSGSETLIIFFSPGGDFNLLTLGWQSCVLSANQGTKPRNPMKMWTAYAGTIYMHIRIRWNFICWTYYSHAFQCLHQLWLEKRVIQGQAPRLKLCRVWTNNYVIVQMHKQLFVQCNTSHDEDGFGRCGNRWAIGPKIVPTPFNVGTLF